MNKKYFLCAVTVLIASVSGCSESSKPAASDIQCLSGQTKCGDGDNLNVLYSCHEGHWNEGTACAEDQPICMTEMNGSSACIAKPETGAQAMLLCIDGLDNDGDTLIDCADEDCLRTGTKDNPGPGMTVCKTPTYAECLDGETKCGRGSSNGKLFTCRQGRWDEGIACAKDTPICMINRSGSSECIAKPTFGYTSILMCSDGQDNDGDTLIDCEDDDCKTVGTSDKPGPGMTVCRTSAVSECSPNQTKCGTGEDINNLYRCLDGKWDTGVSCDAEKPICMIDASGSSSCIAKPQTGYASFILCTDGIDNDGDTLIDCDDADCHAQGTPETPGPGMTICKNSAQEKCTPGDTKCDIPGNRVQICSDKQQWTEHKSCSDNQVCGMNSEGEHDCLDRECRSGAAKCGEGEHHNTLYECQNGRWNEGTDCGQYICGLEFDDYHVPTCHEPCTDNQQTCRRSYAYYEETFVCKDNIYKRTGVCGDNNKYACNNHDDNTISCDECHYDDVICYDEHTLQTCKTGTWETPEKCPDETPDCITADGKSRCIKKECEYNDKKCGDGNDKNTLYTCDENYHWMKVVDCELNHGVCGPVYKGDPVSCHEPCEKGHRICAAAESDNGNQYISNESIFKCNDNNVYVKEKYCKNYCNIHSDGNPYCDKEEEGTSLCVDDKTLKTYTDGQWVTTVCPEETPFCLSDWGEGNNRCIKKDCEYNDRKCGEGSDKDVLYVCSEDFQWIKETDCQKSAEVCGSKFEGEQPSCHQICTEGIQTCMIDAYGLDILYKCNDNNTFVIEKACPFDTPYCNIKESGKAACETTPSYTSQCLNDSILEIKYHDADNIKRQTICQNDCLPPVEDENIYPTCGYNGCDPRYNTTKCSYGDSSYIMKCTRSGNWRPVENCKLQGMVCVTNDQYEQVCELPAAQD